jgi:hypothetical protein
MRPVSAEALGEQYQWGGRQHDETDLERRSEADCPVYEGAHNCCHAGRHEEIPLFDPATAIHDNAEHG